MLITRYYAFIYVSLEGIIIIYLDLYVENYDYTLIS